MKERVCLPSPLTLILLPSESKATFAKDSRRELLLTSLVGTQGSVDGV